VLQKGNSQACTRYFTDRIWRDTGLQHFSPAQRRATREKNLVRLGIYRGAREQGETFFIKPGLKYIALTIRRMIVSSVSRERCRGKMTP
jgi:hypothetical protein